MTVMMKWGAATSLTWAQNHVATRHLVGLIIIITIITAKISSASTV